MCIRDRNYYANVLIWEGLFKRREFMYTYMYVESKVGGVFTNSNHR